MSLRNIPYYLFISRNNEKYIVASKLGRDRKIDHYAKVNIIDNTSKPKKACIQQILGPVNDFDITKKFIL